MQVNEEVDALKTMGISPFDFLVLPRVLALSLMMPLLTVYADLMGIMGGAFRRYFYAGAVAGRLFPHDAESVVDEKYHYRDRARFRLRRYYCFVRVLSGN